MRFLFLILACMLLGGCGGCFGAAKLPHVNHEQYNNTSQPQQDTRPYWYFKDGRYHPDDGRPYWYWQQ